jgi:3-deoxy-D-manno-octulosonic-acid transferase
MQLMNAEQRKQLAKTLGLDLQSQVLVIGSTHDHEEKELLTVLRPLLDTRPHLKILLVPRHPERFETVAKLLSQMEIPYSRLSTDVICQERVVLIDAMGILPSCYQLATLAIVAGSYTPQVGGHNIMEPVLYGVPVLFGPYMRAQQDLCEIVLSARAGQQVSIEALYREILTFLSSPEELEQYRQACETLKVSLQGSLSKTLAAMDLYCKGSYPRA